MCTTYILNFWRSLTSILLCTVLHVSITIEVGIHECTTVVCNYHVLPKLLLSKTSHPFTVVLHFRFHNSNYCLDTWLPNHNIRFHTKPSTSLGQRSGIHRREHTKPNTKQFQCKGTSITPQIPVKSLLVANHVAQAGYWTITSALDVSPQSGTHMSTPSCVRHQAHQPQ